MNSKLRKIIGAFLLLVPFRLTTSVLLIKLFTWTATIGEDGLPSTIVCASVLLSKLCYDLALGGYLCVMVWKLCISKTEKIKAVYDWQTSHYPDWVIATTIITAFLMATFTGFDMYLTDELFWHFNK